MKNPNITKSGKVQWEDLSRELMQLPKEQLVNLVDAGMRNFWSNNNYWIVLTEKNFGVDTATRIDSEVWQFTTRTQARRIKSAMQLGDDIQALATSLKISTLQWVNSGYEWEFVDISDEKLVMKVTKCPMGTYRTKHNIPLYPCKIISPAIYGALAEVINPNISVQCLHACPDASKPGVMCEWEFTLNKKE